ncbi:MAG: hypothetical protein JNL97_08180, partial [Verrucomicrobiales bacterium]|nr:hypothetical protein [Verrucomicrobiales bacterium]
MPPIDSAAPASFVSAGTSGDDAEASFVCVGVSFRTAALEVRERLSLGFDEAEVVLDELREGGEVREAVWLSTCHRLEVYAWLRGPGFGVSGTARETGGRRDLEDRVRRFVDGESPDEGGLDRVLGMFLRRPGISPKAVMRALYAWEGEHAVLHLFRVASGLDSMVVGETEVLGQLKEAYEVALRHGHTGRGLNPLFQAAFQAAKQVRSETGVQRGSVSVATLAASFAEARLGDLDGRKALVLGAGDTAAKVSQALIDRGVGEIRI